ncbi:MAG: NYN domain-containing protein, partial [Vicinamibacterales bacterium]
MPHPERTNIAVFIDFDNIEIGVKTTLGEHFDIGIILEALKERGEVVTKIAYADWTRAGEYSRALTQHAIRLVQRNLTPGGDKNGADINLALDALEMAFTHPHINAYVIVGGDSDFLSLVEKLKQYDKKVFVVGGRSFTSVILQRNCHEFIAYENLMRRPSSSRPPRSGEKQTPAQQSSTQAFPMAQAIPIVRRALKILADREVSPQTGLLKSTLLQLDSTFSERSYGASSFLDFVEKLGQANVVLLKHSGRSVMVELNPAFADESNEPKPRAEGDAPGNGDADNVVAFRPLVDAPTPAGVEPNAAPQPPAAASEPGPRLGDNADGVRAAAQLLTNAVSARWP